MKFALDAMGGDYAPKSVVLGGLNAIEKSSSPIKIIFLGDRDMILSELKHSNAENIEIIHTKDTVSIKDKSSTVIKKRPNSSLVKGIQLLKENKVDAFVSASGRLLYILVATPVVPVSFVFNAANICSLFVAISSAFFT